MQDPILWQWLTVIGFSLLLFFLAPLAKTNEAFYRASGKNNQQPNFWLLTSSLVISWIFAKSITNAANLGLAFGFVGGLAYAAYYLSFIVAGIILYQLRTKGGFTSIHHFLQNRYGKTAVIVFSLLIAFRLFNEVWSNTMVIGTYFGDKDSTSYFIAIIVFTMLTLAYTLKGGLRSSLFTDMIQMALFGVLLFIILGMLLPRENGDIAKFVNSGTWTMAGGLNLLFVALIQVFSYPFHDPVLTDRAFISDPKTTRRSFFWATFIGIICILLFSFVGIYGRFHQMEGQAAVAVSQSLGIGMMLVMNFIMVTSAASTLDSTFAAFSKLANVDLGTPEKLSVQRGRITMIIVAIAGTIPIFLSPEILSATTVSGTMVIGLAPVFLCWQLDMPKWAFHLSVGCGILAGIILATGSFPSSWVFFEGKYGDLLTVNIIGTILCFALFFASRLMTKR